MLRDSETVVGSVRSGCWRASARQVAGDAQSEV